MIFTASNMFRMLASEGKHITTAEVVIIGLLLVFALLAVIILVLVILPKIIAPIEKAGVKRAARKEAKAKAKEMTRANKTANGCSDADTKGSASESSVCDAVQDGSVSPEIIAAITAAITEYESARGVKSFRVASIKRIKKHNFAVRSMR